MPKIPEENLSETVELEDYESEMASLANLVNDIYSKMADGGQEGGESSASPPQKEKKKGGRELDLSVLDEDSIIIMLQLMVRLDEAGVTVDDFFRDICFFAARAISAIVCFLLPSLPPWVPNRVPKIEVLPLPAFPAEA